MPSVPDDATMMRGVTGQAPAPPEPLTDPWGAAFRQANSVVSLATRMSQDVYPAEEGHSSLDNIRGTKYYDQYADRFAGSNSTREDYSIIARIEREENDKRQLAASGAAGTIAQMVAGGLDPLMAMPGGMAVKSGRAAVGIGEAILDVGVASAVQSVAQESILHATQETRPFEESALNVASATILGGLLGGAASRFMTPSEITTAAKAIDRDRKWMNDHAGNPPLPSEVKPGVAEPVANLNTPGLDAGAPGAPMAASAGAAAADVREMRPVPTALDKIPVVGKALEQSNPLTRVLGSKSVAARRAVGDLVEVPTLLEQNIRGEPTVLGGGPAIERDAKNYINSTRVAVGDELDQQWKDMRFAGDKAPYFARTRAAFGQLDNPQKLPNFEEFKEQVFFAMQNDDKHEIPQVAASAKFIRDNVFDPWLKRAQDIGLIDKNIDVKTAESYVQRIWNKQAIAAKRPEFVNQVMTWLKGEQVKNAEAQERLFAYNRDLQAIQDALSKAKTDDRIAALTVEHNNLRKKIEEEIAAWAGTSVAEAKTALKARAKAQAEREAKLAEGEARPKRSISADKDVDTAVRRILEKKTDLDDEALRDQAHEIVNHVEGTPGGRLPYDMQSGGPQEGYRPGANQAPRGPLAERAFNIPDAMVNDFLQHDIEHITNAHLRTMVPDVLIAEHNGGDVNMTDTFRQIQDEYSALIDQSKDQAERTALAKERDNTIRDVAAMRDRIRGTYGMGATTVMPNAARWAAAVKNYNVLASMGMATLSSLPDMAGPVMRYGLGTVFNDAWSPFLKSLMGGGELNREAIRQFRAMGIVVESEIAARHHSLSDTLDSFHPKSRLERTLQVGADRFQFINGLGPWTDFGKLVTSTVASQEIFRAAKAMSEGTATARQLRSLGEASITRDLADRISQQYAESGQVVDGVHLPNTSDWTDKQARRAFEGAVGREADIAIVTPGQEKPLWMSNPLLSVLGQFKSFTAAATQRILVANLQRADAQVLQGVMLSLGLGMMSYKMNSLLGGQPTSDNPGDWVKEAMSRGNMFGWLEEGNAMTSKITRGQLDMYRALGSKHELSRYAGRSVMDQILGPTAGKIEKFQQIAGAAASRDWKESDTHAVHQVTAYGNLFWLRNIFNEVEHGANNAFGIPMKQQ